MSLSLETWGIIVSIIIILAIFSMPWWLEWLSKIRLPHIKGKKEE